MKKFGDTLRDLRLAQDLGLREMAGKIGISPTYLSRIERNKENPPRPEIIQALAKVLAADPDVLFRLAAGADPDLIAYLHAHPPLLQLLRFLRQADVRDPEITRLAACAADLVRARPPTDGTGPPEAVSPASLPVP
ncbi:XRE family transcriptional regulator [Candidatus Falkowbacteria bacterium]|nr:XRE family transcriptional regulator [Candidatus Falkowbacteria bacterium]